MSEIIIRFRDYQQWLDDEKPIVDLIADIKGDRSCERVADHIESQDELILKQAKKIDRLEGELELFR